MPGGVRHQRPSDGGDPSSLMTYPLITAPGSTDEGGGESLMQQQHPYDRMAGSVHSASAAITSSVQGATAGLQRSSSADQMMGMRSYHCRLCKQVSWSQFCDSVSYNLIDP